MLARDLALAAGGVDEAKRQVDGVTKRTEASEVSGPGAIDDGP